ncbi:hypothetical protein [Flavobacterium sp.]|uniref:hypothetical protein n=1 Tax=Flavobacterium sp. TaxID=239 RepID=UPI0026309669|nr:hypothetical protein [Flavobacterium sp.]
MPNTPTYNALFNRFRESLNDGTFAKLTLAKTIGNTDLKNIYVRTTVEDGILKLALKFKIYKDGMEEIEKTILLEELETEVLPYMNNPFLSILLFTTEADVTLKLNKKRVATITEQPPTFKNADPVLLEFLAQSK